jgi:hypothetical protein
VQCGKPIGPNPVCIFERYGNERRRFQPVCEACTADVTRELDRRQFRWWTKDGQDPPDFARDPDAEDNEPLDDKRWKLRACEVCGRAMRARKERVCSSECKSRLPAVAAR